MALVYDKTQGVRPSIGGRGVSGQRATLRRLGDWEAASLRSRDHEHPSQARQAREGWSDAGITLETEGLGGSQTRTLNLRMSVGLRNHFNLQDISVTFPLLQVADPELEGCTIRVQGGQLRKHWCTCTKSVVVSNPLSQQLNNPKRHSWSLHEKRGSFVVITEMGLGGRCDFGQMENKAVSACTYVGPFLPALLSGIILQVRSHSGWE